MNRAMITLAISIAVFSGTVRAAVCDAALVMSTYSSFSTDNLDWRLATLVTEKEWDQIKHDQGSNAVIYGIPVGETYSDFESRVHEKTSSYSESLTHNQMLNILWTGLDPSGASAYSECLHTQLFNGRGLHLAVSSATKTDISLLVSWNPQGNDPSAIAPKWLWEGKGKEQLPAHVQQGLTTVVLPRPVVVHTFAVNYPGFTDSVVLEPLSKLPPLPQPLPLVTTKETYKTKEQPSGRCADYSGWYDLCSDPKPAGWTIVAENFQLYGNRSCTSGWAECQKSADTPSRVCYQFRMQGHSEECGHSGNTGIQYSHGELAVTWQHH